MNITVFYHLIFLFYHDAPSFARGRAQEKPLAGARGSEDPSSILHHCRHHCHGQHHKAEGDAVDAEEGEVVALDVIHQEADSRQADHESHHAAHRQHSHLGAGDGDTRRRRI